MRQASATVRTERHELGETFPDGTSDLISAQYFHTPAEIHTSLDLDLAEWPVERADAVFRDATGPAGQTATMTDHVLLVRRTGEQHPRGRQGDA